MANQITNAATKIWKKVTVSLSVLPIKRAWVSTGYYCGIFIGCGGFLMSVDMLKRIWTGEPPLDEQVKQLRLDVTYVRGLLERVAAAQEAAQEADAAPVVAPAAAAPVVAPPVVAPAAAPVVAPAAAPVMAPAAAPVVGPAAAPTAEN